MDTTAVDISKSSARVDYQLRPHGLLWYFNVTGVQSLGGSKLNAKKTHIFFFFFRIRSCTVVKQNNATGLNPLHHADKYTQTADDVFAVAKLYYYKRIRV